VIAGLESHEVGVPCTTLTEWLESFPYSFQMVDVWGTRASADWRIWTRGGLEMMLKNLVTNQEQSSTSAMSSS